MALRVATRGSASYAGSRRFPSRLVNLSPPPLTDEQCAFLEAELARHGCVPAGAADARAQLPVRFFELVAQAHQALLREAKFFYPEAAELVDVQPEAPHLLVAVPKLLLHPELSATLFIGLASLCARSARDGEAVASWLAEQRSGLEAIERPSSNMIRFLRTAYELDMPVIEWPWPHLQIGHGERAALLKGSITHETPGIGISIARQKMQSKALLAQAGFPVAEGGPVANLAGARRRAQELGFPVAVKPADLDGGTAVACDVRDEQELVLAYRAAREASPNVLVERHIPGKDYRLLFFHDRLLVAIERIPGGVTGNGVDTIATLLEELNRQPDRGDGPDHALAILKFDDDARLMLRRRGMTEQSIPAKGEIIQLRRAANRNRGGTTRVVEDQVHPANLDLARRAMRLLRLDFAGLDLILPDISRPWHESGGVVCEVNAQPYANYPFKSDLFSSVLMELVAGDGRIPLVLVVGELGTEEVAAIAARIPRLAVVDGEGAQLDGLPLSKPGMAWAQACQAALFDPQVAAGLFILSPDVQRPVRSPVDRFSAAYVLGEEEIGPPMAALLRRAGTKLSATVEAGPALKQAGFNPRKLDREKLAEELVGALSVPAVK
jgi:cyanophycin synthetase